MNRVIQNIIHFFRPQADSVPETAESMTAAEEISDTQADINRLTYENRLLKEQVSVLESEKQQLLQRLYAAENGGYSQHTERLLNNTLGVLNNAVNMMGVNRVCGYDNQGYPIVEPAVIDKVNRRLGSEIIEECLKKIKTLV